jgi:outer membrane protein OmpA-like peptidoglycan-associated protein
MSWNECKARVRSIYGEAITVTLLLGALALLVLASDVGAQQTNTERPVSLPPTKISAPRNEFSRGEDATLRGLIIGRNGDDMLVRDQFKRTNVVTLTQDTRIWSPTGLFKLERKQRDVTSLLPGLEVEVRGKGGSRGNLIARQVRFHSSSLRVAQQIAAGEVALSNRISANRDSIRALHEHMIDSLSAVEARARDSLEAIGRRFEDIDRYDAKDSVVVMFAEGGDALDANAQHALDALVARAVTLSGYLVEVRGFADATGNPATNLDLSQRRAETVVQYLAQRNIPLRRILNPTGLGESDPAASNASEAGRALNRRAQVRILVNRAQRD